jgi:hypothetical protein
MAMRKAAQDAVIIAFAYRLRPGPRQIAVRVGIEIEYVRIGFVVAV